MASNSIRVRGSQGMGRAARSRQSSKRLPFRVTSKLSMKSRSNMPGRKNAANEYTCAIEKSQNGKYNVRVRANFDRTCESQTGPWTIHLYFLASSFNAAMKKLEESLEVLQKNEERLRFWGVERTDDPDFAGELVSEYGLRLDRRRDFPRKAAEIMVSPEKHVPASHLAQIRRTLSDSVAQERSVYRAALASD
jgi:hypothetical protein